METYEERVAFCTLNRIFGFKPALARCLVEGLGGAMAAFRLSGRELKDLFGPFTEYPDKINDDELEISRKELQWLEERGYALIVLNDPCYPRALRECPDAPMGLYLRGATPPERVFNTAAAVSIVGTRDVSAYGREWSARIIGALADAVRRPVIVSGLAMGVDVCAHAAALEYGLPTIGVMATGIEGVYPSAHRAIAARIASTEGCALITDYPPGTRPQAINFLRRNRIIAGLSLATVLVESKMKGGGIITAELAFEYDREVFALPGRADDVRSEGCNRIIRSKIAEPLTDLAGFVSALGLGILSRRSKALLSEEINRLFAAQAGPEELARLLQVAALIKAKRGIEIEDIALLCKMEYKEALLYTGMLESEGIIYTDLLGRCSIVFKNA